MTTGTNNIDPLYLLHTQPNLGRMASWIASHHARHSRQPVDMGDAIHGLLRAAFGEKAPQPFRYIEDRNGLLAYTAMDERAIADSIATADPVITEALGLDAYKLRAIPNHWAAGQVFGFEVQVKPTVRSKQGEQDAFLAAVRMAGGKEGAPVDRGEVYARWLHDRINPSCPRAPRLPWHGSAEILDVQVSRFCHSKAVRRTQSQGDIGRERRVIPGPDAVLTGTLRVVDSVAFSRLLARGIGRHRSFGFGMLLLKRLG